MSSREDTPEPGASAADSRQAGPAAARDSRRESAACPECRDASTACSSSCRHCFCRLCLWDWSLGEAACPRCQRPTRHPYPQHVALYHEVQQRVYDSKRRWRGRSAGRPRSCSGRFGHGGPCDRRRRRRSMRWPRDGRWQSWHTRGSDSPRRRSRQRQRRAWEDTPEEGPALRFEWAVPGSSRGSRSRRGSRRSWSQQEQQRGHRRRSGDRERSRGWDRRQGRSHRRDQDTQTDSHHRSPGQRRWRSWNADDRHSPRPQHDVSSEEGEAQQWEDSDSSRQRHAPRRRSRGRSHRRGQDCQAGSQGTLPHEHTARRRSSWNADDRHTPRPQHNTPSRSSERHQWEDWGSSRQQHETRSRTRGRPHQRGQDCQAGSEGTGPHNRSMRQRSWNAEQGRDPRSRRDIPGSSGRSRPQHRSRSRAGRRDT